MWPSVPLMFQFNLLLSAAMWSNVQMMNKSSFLSSLYQVGDMVYMVKATAELPLASPLSARPSSNIVSDLDSSGRKTVQTLCS